MRFFGRKLLIRVFATYLLTATVILFGVGIILFSFRPEKKIFPVVEKNLTFYLESLDQKLKSYPQEKAFEMLAQEYGVLVRREGQEKFANIYGLPSFKRIDKEDEFVSSVLQVGKEGRFLFASIRSQTPRTVWFINVRHFPKGFGFSFFWIILFFAIILALSFLTIRWIISPLRILTTGVEEITKGNLKFRFEIKTDSEISVIANAFNKMAANVESMLQDKERLLRDVSHELRSPLTRIKVASDLIGESKIQASISNDVNKMEVMISGILETARIKSSFQVLHLVEVDFNEIFEGLKKDYQSESVLLSFSYEQESILHRVDVLQIDRLLRNLIENAIKYKKESTTRIELSLRQSTSHQIITVKDYGIGIPEHSLNHIFEPFYRIDPARSHDGFGLGLSICKAIVEAHQGQIVVRSQVNHFTEFEIALPR